MTKDNGGPAFPLPEIRRNEAGASYYQSAWPGMTLRDWFACQAMVGTLNFPDAPYFEEAAKQAYAMADAIIAERTKP